MGSRSCQESKKLYTLLLICIPPVRLETQNGPLQISWYLPDCLATRSDKCVVPRFRFHWGTLSWCFHIGRDPTLETRHTWEQVSVNYVDSRFEYCYQDTTEHFFRDGSIYSHVCVSYYSADKSLTIWWYLSTGLQSANWNSYDLKVLLLMIIICYP